jgi:hypothetical protein
MLSFWHSLNDRGKAKLVGLLLGILFRVGFVIAVIAVIVHFVRKFW